MTVHLRMILPPALLTRLQRAPRLVVAPVGVGFAQQDLATWAEAQGRVVFREPQRLPHGPSLFIPAKRQDLTRLPATWALEEALFLEEADLLLPFEVWRKLLGGYQDTFIEASYAASDGWPEALRLARQVENSSLAFHQHPLVMAHLERLLPQGEARALLAKTACTPLLLPELYPQLELTSADVDGLLDQGYLYARGLGITVPKLLRTYLAPVLEPETVRSITQVLQQRRLFPEALDLLANAGLWEDYLETLTAGFDTQAGEKRLRQFLQPLPPTLHTHPAYRYLVGLLERLRGELDRAQEHYAQAHQDARGELRARIDNARGVVFALQGHLDAASDTFKAATVQATSARLCGEAHHNRAGVLIQQRRYQEAEDDLRAAVARFREGGEYVREARSLQLLALAYHQRGLLKEAERGYQDALELLETLGQPTAFVRMNLSEALLLRGEMAEALVQLEQAEREAQGSGSQRTRGYVRVNRALWHVAQEQHEAALSLVNDVLQSEGLDTHLAAEASLLLARIHRLNDRKADVAAHLEAARPLGLRATLEEALNRDTGLDEVIAQAREEEARFELATALLHRAGPDDLQEALALIQAHGYGLLLQDARHAPRLAALAQNDPALLELFPLELRVFGTFSAHFLGRTLTLPDFPTRKSAALLLRLALAPHPLSREGLAETFWGDTGNPLHSLQTALYHLNRTLGVQVVTSRRGSISLAYPVMLDVTTFEQNATRALNSSVPDQHRLIREILAAAQEQPFADFPEWFDEERRAAEALRVKLLRRLIELDNAEPYRVVETLETLLRLEPYDFESRRHLIDLYAELGEMDLMKRETERLQTLEKEF